MPSFCRSYLAYLVALIGLVMAVPAPVQAQDLAAALTGFASDSFNDTEAAIVAVAASGDPRAAEIISALESKRLLVEDGSNRIILKTTDGALVDAATGAPVAEGGAKLEPVRVNNRIRRAIAAAMGSLTLMSPDPAKRLAAAHAVFKSRDATAVPVLEAAIENETLPNVKQALIEARAAALFANPATPEAERVEAITILRERGGQEVIELLAALPADTPAAVADAAAAAVTGIKSELALWTTVQNAIYGLSLGSVLLLAAIALAITFGVMGVINMAHGEMVMLGAYTTFVVQEIIRDNFPWLFDWSLAIAIPLAFLVSGFVGLLVERGIIRWLYGRPLETLLATWGLSLILQQLVRTVFGPNNRQVGNPSWMSGELEIGALSITYGRLWIIVFALVVFAALIAVMRYTRFGLQMRAVTQNRGMASSIGIRTPYVDALTFALGSGIAGIAGVALSQIDNVSPNLGQTYIIDSFMVVVFGGVGNLWGTLVAALTLGVANKFLEPFAGAVLGKILVLVFIILFIQKRPRGLFALRGRAVEA